MFLLLIWAAIVGGQRSKPAPEATSFRFAIVSDTHIGGAASAQEDLRRTVADINADTTLAFTIITGDVTELGWDAELAEAYALLSQLRRPWYVIPGNHDTKWSESGNNSFRQVFGYERFFFQYKDYAFIGCSSGPNMRMAPGLVPAEDLRWLDSVLQQLPAHQPLFFFNHYPLDAGLANWYKVIELLKRVNTQAAFCGHGHTNKAFDAEGIPSAMCRSNLRARADTGAYTVVTVWPDVLTLAERKPGGITAAPWHRIPLGQKAYAADTTVYARPSYEVNEQHPQVQRVWLLQDSCDIGAGIAVAGRLAVYANTCGQVKAIDAQTGALRWHFTAKGKIYATPAIAEGKVVFASADSNIYCLNGETGALVWMLKTGKAIVASPLVYDGTVYIGSSEGAFRAISLKDGRILWTFRGLEAFVETRPVADAQRIYFGTWDTYFYALNRKDGTLAWKWHNGNTNRLYAPAAVWPVLAHGKVFIVAPDRFATALDVRTGRQVWRTPNRVGRESIGLSQDARTLYVKSMNDTVYAFDAVGHVLKLRAKVMAGYGYDIAPSPMAERDGTLYIPTDKGVIIAVDTRNWQIKWAHKLCNALINNIVPLERGAVMGTAMDGKVFYLTPGPAQRD